MGYHFGVGWLQGGFFSLDIFYVLSGYLITGLLVSEYRKRSAIKLSAFWLRRARRLLPALLIVLVAVTLLVRFVSAPVSTSTSGERAVRVVLFPIGGRSSPAATTSSPPGRCPRSPTPGRWRSRSSSTWSGPWWCWP